MGKARRKKNAAADLVRLPQGLQLTPELVRIDRSVVTPGEHFDDVVGMRGAVWLPDGNVLLRNGEVIADPEELVGCIHGTGSGLFGCKGTTQFRMLVGTRDEVTAGYPVCGPCSGPWRVAQEERQWQLREGAAMARAVEAETEVETSRSDEPVVPGGSRIDRMLDSIDRILAENEVH